MFFVFLSDFGCLDWMNELDKSCSRWNRLPSLFTVPVVVFKTRMHLRCILLDFAREIMKFSITNLCFFSKVGGGLDTGEAAALASSPYNVLHESFKLGNIRGLMMFLLLIIVVTDVCYVAVDCSTIMVFCQLWRRFWSSMASKVIKQIQKKKKENGLRVIYGVHLLRNCDKGQEHQINFTCLYCSFLKEILKWSRLVTTIVSRFQFSFFSIKIITRVAVGWSAYLIDSQV